ncbi:MAG TPA: biopolymer transporter ExbD [Planctomycetaceae bacterium]|jgi:biopolymer transport protein ExbD|nr:biopolymer transporter ExbD [Planctomycetaceae bacterium]
MRVPKIRSGPVCDFDRTVTPMVDVVFQLLVFFVLASGGRIAERTLATALSAGAVGSTVSQPASVPERTAEIWLHLRRDSAANATTLRVNDGPSGELADLSQKIKALKGTDPTSSVILDVQGNIPWGDVIQVYDTCRAAKFRAINFAAAPQELR